MVSTPRRVSHVFLCLVPVLAIGFAAPRALRVAGVYQTIGGVLFTAIVMAAWILGARAIRGGAESEQRLALAGTLLLTPFTLVALFWVGLGAPVGSDPARERDAVSRPACEFDRGNGWIRPSQGRAQRRR